MYCLTGNGPNPVRLGGGTYSYFVPALGVELFPEHQAEPGQSSGAVPFAGGALTSGKDACVEWAWTRLRAGLEVVFDLGCECVVDRVVIRHKTSPSTFENYRDPHMSDRGIGRLEVWLAPAAGERGVECAAALAAEDRTLPEVIEVAGIGRRARQVRLRITPRVCLGLQQVQIFGTPLPLAIYPTPQEQEYAADGPLPISAKLKVWIARDADRAVADVADFLAERIARRTGLRLKVGRGGVPGCCLAVSSRPPAGKFPPLRSRGDEAYALAVSPKAALARARSPRGLRWAAASLAGAISETPAGPAFSPVSVQDWPDVDVRALHLYLPAEEDIEWYLRWLEYLADRCKYNTLFLELGTGMRFERHPELYEAQQAAFAAVRAAGWDLHTLHGEVAGGKALSGEQVAEIVRRVRSCGMEVIPEFQSFSHAGWYLTAHRDLAEIPEDPVPVDHCPSNPATYELVFDLLAEVIEKLAPRGVHIGHDEVRVLGACPRCRGIDGAKLFADDVNRMHAFLTERNIRTYMWSDHLIRRHNGQFHGTHLAADMIPKDIVLLNWTPRSYLGPIDEQVDQGFEEYTAGGYHNLFRDKPLLRQRGGRPYRKGYVLTTWTAPNAAGLGLRGSLTDFVCCAETLWSQSAPAFEGPAFWAAVTDECRRMRREVLDETPPAGESAPVALPAWPRLPEDGFCPQQLPRRIWAPGGVLFEVDGRCGLAVEHPGRREAVHPPQAGPVPVERLVNGLAFLITALGDGRGPAGALVIRYAGGEEVTLPLVQEFHVGGAWRYPTGELSDAQPLPGADLAWLGQAGGRPTAVYSLTWTNPRPDRPVQSVRLAAPEPPTPATVLWLGLTCLVGREAGGGQ